MKHCSQPAEGNSGVSIQEVADAVSWMTLSFGRSCSNGWKLDTFLFCGIYILMTSRLLDGLASQLYGRKIKFRTPSRLRLIAVVTDWARSLSPFLLPSTHSSTSPPFFYFHVYFLLSCLSLSPRSLLEPSRCGFVRRFNEHRLRDV